MKPPRPLVRVLLTVGGLVCLVVGGLWVLFFLAMLIFGGLDVGEKVGFGHSMGTQGSAIVFIGLLGVFPLFGGAALMSRASGR
ncbi:hypothetical protein K2F54_09520 [Cryobacterium sp. 1639]|uniref:hypothetical protein n=1 Tax=Cryobacterium inferilacus TaxID=2866629 RepID=UPI001C72D2B5|nr:hypothetical protein [Cryobacterium sp. 1639]MBX0300213.1 hypothetical protein [Cryobacterium sp. 1639]